MKNNFSKWREVVHQRSYAAPAPLAAVSVPGGSRSRTWLPHKQPCQPYPASRRLTMNSQNYALPVLQAPTGRNRRPEPNDCESRRIHAHVSSWPIESRAKNDDVFVLQWKNQAFRPLQKS